MSRNRLFFVALVLGAVTGGVGTALAQGTSSGQTLHASCIPDKGQAGWAKCDLRFANPVLRPEVSSVEVKFGDRTTTANYEALPAADQVAVLFLIDTSKSVCGRPGVAACKKAVEAIRSDIEGVLARKRSRHVIGISTFADKIESIADVGTSRDGLSSAIQKMELKGGTTALYARTEDALNELISVKDVSRKFLVLMSDGISEDEESEYLKTNVLALASSNNIPIVAIGYEGWDFKAGKRRPQGLQSLKRLAKETNGFYIEADAADRTFPIELKDSLLDFTTSGGTATFALGGSSKFEITAKLADGSAPAPASVEISEAVPDENIGIGDWWDRLSDKWKWIYGSGAFGGVALLALGLFFMRRRRASRIPSGAITEEVYSDPNFDMPGPGAGPSPITAMPTGVGPGATGGLTLPAGGYGGGAPTVAGHPPGTYAPTELVGNGAAAPTSADGAAYAWLQRQDTSEQIAIRQTAVRIGRHEDNDIRFVEDSVHRRHATIHMTPERAFYITDLTPERGNHVEVNGERVAGKQSLRDGDTIKLGAVMVRFSIVTV